MRFSGILTAALLTLLLLVSSLPACSTFTLGEGDEVYVGRNLGAVFEYHFLVVVNKRGVRKESISYAELMSGQRPTHLPVSWVSEYGSITLNGSAAEFPEGGMNETGLVIEEMTLIKTKYPVNEDRATFFMELWIQYVLDTCATVAEVIESAKTISLDGWGWHFMAVDATGSSAVIEFIDGKPVILTGESLPYPILCNSAYSEELEKLAKYQGFGGTEIFDEDNPPPGDNRFQLGVMLLKEYDPAGATSPVEYAITVANAITSSKWGLVQKVYDIKRRRMYFRTRTALNLRWIDLDAFDLGCGSPRMVIMAHEDLEGDVSGKLEPYTDEAARAVLLRLFEASTQNPEYEKNLEAQGTTIDAAIGRQLDYSKTTRCLCDSGAPE